MNISVVRTHTMDRFANPFLVCVECHRRALGWHNPAACECAVEENWWLSPCLHEADTQSLCPSWSPVDGCVCPAPCVPKAA